MVESIVDGPGHEVKYLVREGFLQSVVIVVNRVGRTSFLALHPQEILSCQRLCTHYIMSSEVVLL